MQHHPAHTHAHARSLPLSQYTLHLPSSHFLALHTCGAPRWKKVVCMATATDWRILFLFFIYISLFPLSFGNTQRRLAIETVCRYDGKWFYRFQKVTVEVESYKITGVITSISPVTLWIRRKINGLHPVTLGDLKTGKALLRLATGREN